MKLRFLFHLRAQERQSINARITTSDATLAYCPLYFYIHHIFYSTNLQEFLCTRPHPRVEYRTANWSVRRVERIQHRLSDLFSSTLPSKGQTQTHLDVQLPHLVEEGPDPVIVLRFMEQNKLHICRTLVHHYQGA